MQLSPEVNNPENNSKKEKQTPSSKREKLSDKKSSEGSPTLKQTQSSKREKLKCPFPGCDGKGHKNKKYPTHRR